MVRLALLSALSDRADIGRIVVVDDWKIEAPKTKDAATIVRKLKLSGSVLIVLAQDELDVERSFANLPQAQTTTFGELSAHDVLRSDWLRLLRPHAAHGRLGLLRDPRGRRSAEAGAETSAGQGRPAGAARHAAGGQRRPSPGRRATKRRRGGRRA